MRGLFWEGEVATKIRHALRGFLCVVVRLGVFGSSHACLELGDRTFHARFSSCVLAFQLSTPRDVAMCVCVLHESLAMSSKLALVSVVATNQRFGCIFVQTRFGFSWWRWAFFLCVAVPIAIRRATVVADCGCGKKTEVSTMRSICQAPPDLARLFSASTRHTSRALTRQETGRSSRKVGASCVATCVD